MRGMPELTVASRSINHVPVKWSMEASQIQIFIPTVTIRGFNTLMSSAGAIPTR